MFDTFLLIVFGKAKPKANRGNRILAKLANPNITISIFLIFTLQFFTIPEVSSQDLAANAPKQCPYYWRQWNNRCLFTNGTASVQSRDEAASSCVELGGQLSRIFSFDENQYIRRVLQGYDPTWIGAGFKSQDKNHIWEWMDGTKMNYSNFNENGIIGGDCQADCCGLTVDKNGNWVFLSCDNIQPYICEIDLDSPEKRQPQPQPQQPEVNKPEPEPTAAEQPQTVHRKEHHPEPPRNAEPPAEDTNQQKPTPKSPAKKTGRAMDSQTSRPGRATRTHTFGIHNILPLFILVLKLLN